MTHETVSDDNLPQLFGHPLSESCTTTGVWSSQGSVVETPRQSRFCVDESALIPRPVPSWHRAGVTVDPGAPHDYARPVRRPASAFL